MKKLKKTRRYVLETTEKMSRAKFGENRSARLAANRPPEKKASNFII